MRDIIYEEEGETLCVKTEERKPRKFKSAYFINPLEKKNLTELGNSMIYKEEEEGEEDVA